MVSRAYAQDYSVYYHGKKVTYGVAPDKLVVKFKDKSSLEQLQKKPDDLLPSVLGLRGGGPKSLGGPKAEIVLVELKPGTGKDKDKVGEAIKTLKARLDVVYASPVLTVDSSSVLVAVTDEFVVQAKQGIPMTRVLAIANQLGVTLLRQYEFDSRTYFFSVDKKKGDVFTLANTFFETGLFEYAEPNYVTFKSQDTADPLFGAQWGLRNVGQYGSSSTAGADMKVIQAWNLPGSCRGAGIRVALIDDGVQLDHPDLRANLEPGYDATHQGSAGGPAAGDSHGTKCAGIIAAVTDNNIGVAGVAPYAHLIPIRIIYGWANVDEQAAEGFDWARTDNRADIISCSWGGGPYNQQLEAAIGRAVLQGRVRNGQTLGCVVLFSAGNTDANNSGTAVRYPAKYPLVIAVGASTLCDRRKRKDYDDCSGSDERFWGSCYGTELDIVAPGVKIPTTDTNGGYTEDFRGTSAACPNAAGVMALILSTAPSLTQSNARRVLESTATKVYANGNPYYYSTVSGQPNGSWNGDVGYGRVDAYAAVSALLPRIIINQPVVGHLCSSSNNYGPFYHLENGYVNYSVFWSSSNPSLATVHPSAGNVTVNMQGLEGYTTITAEYQTGCGTRTLSQNVYVGELSNAINGIYRSDDYFCDGGRIQYYAYGPGPDTGIRYEWNVTGQASIYGNRSGTYLDVVPYNNGGNADYTVNLTVSGSCGTYTLSTQESVNVYQLRQAMNCPGDLVMQYAFYPNPSTAELTVEAVEKPAPSSTANSNINTRIESGKMLNKTTLTLFEAKLYDSYGKTVSTGKSSKGRIVFNVLTLPNGLYTVRVGTGKAATSRRIQITH